MRDTGCESNGDNFHDWEGDGRDATVAFSRTFTHIPDHVRQDLETLERECVVYTDYWIEEVGDFRHVRIDFTPEERSEFARRSWAYELFLRAESTWAAEVPEIDEDIARDADTYSSKLKDGREIKPPYHCFAAFLCRHLEALVCSRTERQTVIQLEGWEAALFEVKRAIHSLTATIRSFNNREKGLDPWTISCEDDVRDLVYVILRYSTSARKKLFRRKPEPTSSLTCEAQTFRSFCSVLELKWIGRKRNWKRTIAGRCAAQLPLLRAHRKH